MKDALFPASIALYLAQVPTPPSDWANLVKEFGTWIIWLAIAVYFYKRGEKRDDADRAERSKENLERLDVQNKILKALEDQANHTHRLVRRFKGKPCFSATDEDEDDGL